MELEFFASCLSGLEKPLADELKSFGIKRVRPLGGGVAFFCKAEDAYRVCLWSRLASRIMLVLGRVNAGDAELLYAGVYKLPWQDILASDASMAVRAHGANDELRNSRFTALKVKDAVVDKMRSVSGQRPDIDASAPRAAIDVRIRDRRAVISLDFSGEALNHRTYLTREDGDDAALECTLAAAALSLSSWESMARQGAAFVDPVCQNGILITEAASMACDCAPGLLRQRWGFYGWAGFDSDAFAKLVAEADERFEQGIARIAGTQALSAPANERPDLTCVRFAGASSSSPFIKRAREHVRRAGLRQVVTVELADASSVAELVARVSKVAQRNPLTDVSPGPEDAECATGGATGVSIDGLKPGACLVASNLDSSVRADARAHVQADEATYAAACAAAQSGSRFAVLNAQSMMARFGGQPRLHMQLGKNRTESSLLVFDEISAGMEVIEIPDMAGGAPHRVEVFERASEQFAARLRKVVKERRKWATRAGVANYRIYDSDLPDYAVAIDWFTGAGDARGNSYLHIAEYAPPSSVNPDKARRRFDDVLAIAPIVCGVRPDHVFSKTRVREKGGGQYRNAGYRPYVTTIEENGYRFEVDLAGRLDVGLFLDHRLTRQLVESSAEGARFCNLFAYTGTASVYAAGGGATSTVTIDMSQTYLDWARRNMAANGFSGEQHKFEKADVMRWITEARRSGRRFDLMFVDPPTFSNSKSMGKRTWDVQRDHVELLIGVAHLLAEDGFAIFSCNLRTFKPYLDQLEKYGVELEDISGQTIPEDFARTPKIHKCYLVRRA